MATPNLQLRRERQLRGWSQAYMAEQIGVLDYYVSRWERGEVSPSPFYQQRLCELFGKTGEELGFLPSINKIPLQKTNSSEKNVSFLSAYIPTTVDIKKNPFTYGNPISEPTRFFGRKLEVEQIFSRLRNAEFESSSIVGERRIGKTSLLKYLAHPHVRQNYGLDLNNYSFVYVDLQIVDENTTPTRLWQWLLRQIASCCADPHIKQVLSEVYTAQSIDAFVLEDVFDSIDAKDQYVVLLLDEFENVTENTNFQAAFFYGLRSLAIHHHLSLITSSRRELIELCHSQAIRSSPFFNIFANINMGLFTKNEALELISQLLNETEIHFTDTEVATLLRAAGFHPYFLQAACSFLFDTYAKNVHLDEQSASFLKAFREEAEPHLAFYWHSSDEHEKIILILLALIERQRKVSKAYFSIRQLQNLIVHTSQTLEQLEKRGLVVAVGEDFSLFNELFDEWIWNELVDTRRNQQSYQEWLTANKRVADRLKSLPDTTQKEMDEILSMMNSEYRELLLVWLSEPNILRRADELIKGFLAFGWGLST